MWYLTTALLVCALLWLHLFWRRRYALAENRLREKDQKLEEQQRRHAQALADRQAQQEVLFNSMTEGVLVLNRAGRIELINESLQRLLSPAADVRGQTVLEAFRLQELTAIVERLGREGVVGGCEVELPGMNERWLEVSAAAVLDDQGGQRGAILVFHDLTRLKQLENTRQEFVANVSHELRTPLSLIKGFVETLLEGAKDDPVLSTRFLNTIEKHTDRLTYLIEDLLTISRLESGQVVMNLQPINVREEVDRVVDELQSRAAEKKMTLQNSIPADMVGQADADRLHQVFFNLVENAIKYGRNLGRVSIGGKPFDENKIELWVQDDGPGVPPEAKERVFERFYRVDRARSRETGGTGLGLAIVKHIVQAHGGEVWLKSELGVGSTFFLTLKGGRHEE